LNSQQSRTGKGIEREEVKEAAEGLGALRDAGDGFGLQRVQGPERRCRERGGGAVERGAFKWKRGERPAEEAEEREGGGRVDREVERVVAPHVFPRDGVVDGEGRIHDRTARRRAAVRRRQENLERIEAADRGVVEDGSGVVEEEGRMQRVRVGQNQREDEARRREPSPREGAPSGFTAGGDDDSHGDERRQKAEKKKLPLGRGS
jgi:hypothetical protein